MTRDEFIRYAAISALVAKENEAEQRHAAANAKATAEKLADAFGAQDDAAEGARRIAELEAQVLELQAQLEQATAPKKGGR